MGRLWAFFRCCCCSRISSRINCFSHLSPRGYPSGQWAVAVPLLKRSCLVYECRSTPSSVGCFVPDGLFSLQLRVWAARKEARLGASAFMPADSWGGVTSEEPWHPDTPGTWERNRMLQAGGRGLEKGPRPGRLDRLGSQDRQTDRSRYCVSNKPRHPALTPL